MRAVAIIFILLSVGANFYFNNLSSLVLAMFSFPVLVWLLVRKRKPKVKTEVDAPRNNPKTSDVTLDQIEEDKTI